jgi:hypothetical protein
MYAVASEYLSVNVLFRGSSCRMVHVQHLLHCIAPFITPLTRSSLFDTTSSYPQLKAGLESFHLKVEAELGLSRSSALVAS